MAVDTRQLRALAVDFRTASTEFHGQADEIIAAGGYEIEARAKVAAPVDTGALRSSLSTDTGDLEATVGPTVDYGGYVELGTSRMAPEPYLAPAFDAVIDDIVDQLAGLGDL